MYNLTEKNASKGKRSEVVGQVIRKSLDWFEKVNLITNLITDDNQRSSITILQLGVVHTWRWSLEILICFSLSFLIEVKSQEMLRDSKLHLTIEL